MMLDRLKAATQREHEQIETTLNLLHPAMNVARYRNVLARFYGFYAPLEPRVAATLATTGLAFDFAPRCKTPLLRADLAAFGVGDEALGQLPLCQNLPAVDTPAQVFGYLYVAEGSTLGGQLLARHFAQTLGISTNNGGAFFHAYGAETAARWQEFRAAIQTFAAHSAASESILLTARDTFAKLDEWFK